jgi:hypothetical protein
MEAGIFLMRRLSIFHKVKKSSKTHSSDMDGPQSSIGMFILPDR